MQIMRETLDALNQMFQEEYTIIIWRKSLIENTMASIEDQIKEDPNAVANFKEIKSYLKRALNKVKMMTDIDLTDKEVRENIERTFTSHLMKHLKRYLDVKREDMYELGAPTKRDPNPLIHYLQELAQKKYGLLEKNIQKLCEESIRESVCSENTPIPPDETKK
jgi:hypothetical protein